MNTVILQKTLHWKEHATLTTYHNAGRHTLAMQCSSSRTSCLCHVPVSH